MSNQSRTMFVFIWQLSARAGGWVNYKIVEASNFDEIDVKTILPQEDVRDVWAYVIVARTHYEAIAQVMIRKGILIMHRPSPLS